MSAAFARGLREARAMLLWGAVWTAYLAGAIVAGFVIGGGACGLAWVALHVFE